MAKKWTDYQRQIAEVILRHRADTPTGYSYKAVKEELPTTSSGKISEIAKALRENNWVIPPKDGQKTPKEKEGGKLATVTARQPAPVVFMLGKQEIELDTECIYESYLLFLDLKSRVPLKSDFSSVIRDGVGLLWQILASQAVVDKEEVRLEVSHVTGSPGDGKGETGVEH